MAEEYILEELPIEDENPHKDKLFRTPEGNEYRVRVRAGGPGAITLSVNSNELPDHVLYSTSIPLASGRSADDIKNEIENQITNSIRTVEGQEAAKQEANKYLEDTWGINLDEPIRPPVPTPGPMLLSENRSKIKFLGQSNKGDEQEELVLGE